jgi:hypothetical protein
MKKFIPLFLGVVFLFIMSTLAYCQVVDDPPVPLSDFFNDIIELVRNWKGMGALAISSAILTLIVHGLRVVALGDLFDSLRPGIKRAAIIILGQVQGIVLAISGGMAWWEAILTGLLTSGGAIAIYECLKPLLNKAQK